MEPRGPGRVSPCEGEFHQVTEPERPPLGLKDLFCALAVVPSLRGHNATCV